MTEPECKGSMDPADHGPLEAHPTGDDPDAQRCATCGDVLSAVDRPGPDDEEDDEDEESPSR